MDQLFQLRRTKRGKVFDYSLYGPDGECRLCCTFRHALYVPQTTLQTPSGEPVATISRGKFINFDITLANEQTGHLFTIAVPRIQTMFRKRPFDVTDSNGTTYCSLWPRVTWMEAFGKEQSVWDTITDDDLVVMRGQTALGHSSHAGEDPLPPPTAAKVAGRIVTLPLEIGKYIYDEVTGANTGKEMPSGALRLTEAGRGMPDSLIMTILLFRRFDYRSMRQVE